MSISQMPRDWEKKALGKVADLTMGQSPSSDTYNQHRLGLPFFQGKADFGPHNPVVRLWCSEPSKVAAEGSILFSVRAPVGDVNITLSKCCIGRGLAAINATSSEQSFLYQKLQYVKPNFQKLAQGSTFEAINGTEMREFKLTLPPLPEQKKIAAILSSVDDVIEKTQAQINKLKDLKTGMTQELLTKGIGHTEFKDSPVGLIPVGWDVKPLSDLTLMIKSGLSRRIASQDIGLPVLVSGNIQDNKLDVFELKYWYQDDPQGANTSNYVLNDGDILVCFINSLSQIGKSCIYRDIGRPTIYTTNMFRVVPIREISSEYLHIIFSTNRFRDEIQLITKPAVNQASFTKADFEQLMVPVPSRDERDKITEAVYSVNRTIDALCSKLEATKNQKKALMQDLLTGTVRVKVDTEEVIALSV